MQKNFSAEKSLEKDQLSVEQEKILQGARDKMSKVCTDYFVNSN